MGKDNSASVLILDDKEEGHALGEFLLSRNIASKVLHPEEVRLHHLIDADLVLVDYRLDDWAARDSDQAVISRRPRDGLALSSVLRRHVHDQEKASPTAFAILTGEIEQLAAPLPPDYREHV